MTSIPDPPHGFHICVMADGVYLLHRRTWRLACFPAARMIGVSDHMPVCLKATLQISGHAMVERDGNPIAPATE